MIKRFYILRNIRSKEQVGTAIWSPLDVLRIRKAYLATGIEIVR